MNNAHVIAAAHIVAAQLAQQAQAPEEIARRVVELAGLIGEACAKEDGRHGEETQTMAEEIYRSLDA
ncbi:hypothetical protein OL229_05295 [Neisseriaceae bacterium JH1-16]|nr:hypothetical protein [Neisseriaceae bacterium JH1-16]